MRLDVLAFRHLASVIFIVAIAGAASAADWPELAELTNIRDELRAELRERASADPRADPFDLALRFDKGIGKGAMLITLRRQGDTWHVRGIEGVKNPEDVGINAGGLAWDGTTLSGALEVTWPTEDDDAPPAAQTFAIDGEARPIDPRLVLRLRRYQGADDWVLAYKPDGDAWAFDSVVSEPRRAFADWGPWDREYGRIEPANDGAFEATINLTYRGDKRQLVAAYGRMQPTLRLTGRLIDGRASGTWLSKAPGGKHIFNSGQDAINGALQTSAVSGKALAEGDKGKWIAAVRGSITPAPRDPVASIVADDGPPPSGPAEAISRAAAVYREIGALRQAIAGYPLPLPDAMRRTQAPAPVLADDAPDEAAHRYLRALLNHAQQADHVPTPHEPADIDAPWYGQADLTTNPAGNAMPLGAGEASRWQALSGWRVLGPFGVFDQEADVRLPEVVDVPGVSYARARLFVRGEGETDVVEDEAVWRAAHEERGRVRPPADQAGSSGAERFFVWYAATTIQSATDHDATLAIRLDGRAMVWINGSLAWDSGPAFDSANPVTFVAPLREGRNQVLVRCASNRASTKFFDRVNWFDGFDPRPTGRTDFASFALYARSTEPTVAATPASAGPIPLDGAAFRRDGSGVYPDAAPPTAWDLDASVNVAWTTPLLAGAADPVVHADRVYLTAEPNLLLCLDAATGEVVWQREVVADAASPSKPTKRTGHQATATPVVAGGAVYAHFGTGVAGCFAVADGAPRWVVNTGAVWNQPNMGSPVLIGESLVLQAHLPGEDGDFGLLALSAEGGGKLWEARGGPKRVLTRHDRAAGFGNGIAVMRLTRDGLTKDLIITGEGAVLDAADGALLHRDIFTLPAIRTAPYVHGRTVYTAPALGQEAVDLDLLPDGRVSARTKWVNVGGFGRGQTKTTTHWGNQHWMKEPVIAHGLMYVVRVDSAHVPQHYPVPRTQLEVYDLETGRRVARQRAMLYEATDPTVRPAIAGKYLYVADGGMPVGGFGGTGDFGQIAVLELRPPDTVDHHERTAQHTGVWGLATPVARNKAPQMRAAPVFAGDRLFLRGVNQMVCIAATTPEGKRYELEQMAQTSVKELIGKAPEVQQTVHLEAEAAPPAHDGVPLSILGAGRGASGWLVLGPLPLDSAAEDAVLAASPAPGVEVAVDEKAYAFRAVEPRHNPGGQADTVAALEGQRNGDAYFFTYLESRQAQRLRYDPQSIVQQAWVAGQPIAKGDEIDFELGYYPMVVKVRLNKLPPFVKSPKLGVWFARPKQTHDTPEAWADRVGVLSDRLEQIRAELPRTGYARAATLSLRKAGLLDPEAEAD